MKIQRSDSTLGAQAYTPIGFQLVDGVPHVVATQNKSLAWFEVGQRVYPRPWNDEGVDRLDKNVPKFVAIVVRHEDHGDEVSVLGVFDSLDKGKLASAELGVTDWQEQHGVVSAGFQHGEGKVIIEQAGVAQT